MSVTIQEVAEAAGVSKATVSKVLHKSYSISQETCDRVNAVIKELGYQPNRRAQSFAKEDIENSLDHAMQAVTLEITERCNLRCDYCIYNENDSDFRQFGSTDISPDTIKTALDFFFARCGKEFNVGFYGGEPLIRFDL